MWAERAVRVVNFALPDLTEYDVSSWAVYQTHLPHALLGYELIKEWQLAFPEAARLLDQVGVYLRDHARYSEAEHMLHDGLVMREKLLGYSHPLVVQSINNLATLYWERSEFDESQALYERALALCEQGSVSHLEKVTSLINLASVYLWQNKFGETESLLQKASLLCEEALAGTYAGHVQTTDLLACSSNNLGVLYHVHGRYQDAKTLYLRAYTLWEQLYGAQHPSVATSLHNLGRNYQFLGDYESSESYHLRALTIREQALSTMHPLTATSLNNLSELYCVQERYYEAEPLLRRALHIRETSFGSMNTDVGTTLENLARLLHNTGRGKEAQDFEERAKSIRSGKKTH